MNKQTLLILLSAALLLCGCHSSTVKISGRFVGNDAKNIYLEQVILQAQTVIDSAVLDKEGNFRFQFESELETPSLYYVVYNSERIPLLLAAGDRVTLNAMGSVVRNYSVEGSKESALLREFYQGFVIGAHNLDNMATQFAKPGLTEVDRDTLLKDYTTEYYRIRREQLRFIVEHKASLAAVFALYQRLPGDTYLFDGKSDIIYYRTVAEALALSYPESLYLQALQSDIARMDAHAELASRIIEADFPDIDLPDIYGKRIKLSSLIGKVVLLDFWSAELGNSNVLNAELKEIYRKYSEANIPFEVYQVAIDTSKPLWINTVQEQQLPWISVSDLRGQSSTVLRLYNIQRLPTNFLIDKNGTIVVRDIYGKELEKKLDELTK